MAAPTSEATQKIAAALEATYQSLRRTANNIRALLASGRATCAEIKAYNLWALAVYNTQRGMLVTLRAAGESNVPDLPAYPTLFAWRGTAGVDAWRIDCNTQQQGLSGALQEAMAQPGPQTVYLSTREVDVITENQSVINANDAPTLATVARMADGTLGWVFVAIIIAAVVISVGAAGLYALSRYWEEQSIQEETTQRTKIQAEAFERYTATRVACQQDCLARGNSIGDCTTICNKLIVKPDLKIDSSRKPGSTSFITGGAIAAIAGIGGLVLLWRRRNRIKAAFNSDAEEIEAA